MSYHTIQLLNLLINCAIFSLFVNNLFLLIFPFLEYFFISKRVIYHNHEKLYNESNKK